MSNSLGVWWEIWYTVMYIGKTLDISMLFGFCSFLPILKTQQNPNRSAVLRCWLLFSPSVLYKYFWSFWSLSKLLNTATRYMKLRQANWWPGGWSSHGHWWPQSGHRFRLFIGTSFRRGHLLHFYNPYLYLYYVQCVIINMPITEDTKRYGFFHIIGLSAFFCQSQAVK